MKSISSICTLLFFCFLVNLNAQQVPLHGLWADSTGAYFVQIDPYTATHTIINQLDNITALVLGSSTVNHNQQTYIFNGIGNTGSNIYYINIESGITLDSIPAQEYLGNSFKEFEYDLRKRKMWGLSSTTVTDTVVTIYQDTLTNDTITEINYITSNIASLASLDLFSSEIDSSFTIPSLSTIALNSSTFNSNAGQYIFIGNDGNSGLRLYTINTFTGEITYNPNTELGNAELQYDNTLNKLFGLIRSDFDNQIPLQLVEINQETAENTVISTFPEISAVVLGGSAYIDDSSHFVFTAIDTFGTKRFYVTDVATGMVVSNTAVQENYREIQYNKFSFAERMYSTSFDLSLKLLLEGSYDTNGEMSNLGNAFIPLNQPYQNAPYFYNGDESLTQIPTDMVDWLLIEVRAGIRNETGNRATETLATKAAILKTDGSVVGTDGNPLNFNGLPSRDDYYLCIRHRNHLDILTSASFQSTGTVSYDLTTAIDKAFGSNQLKLSSDGKAIMYAGDFSQDGLIQTTDFDKWYKNPAALNSYDVIDGNLDGTVQVTDFDTWFINKAKVGTAEIQY